MKASLNKALNRAFSETLESRFPQQREVVPETVCMAVIEAFPELAKYSAMAYMVPLFRAWFRGADPPDAAPYQEFFPFRDFGERIPLAKGSVPIGDATPRMIRESIRVIGDRAEKAARRRAELQIAKLKRVLDDMRPFTRAGRKSLTVSRYCQLRAAGVEPAHAHAATAKAAR